MIYKERTESDELLILRSLFNRMDLEEKDKHYYLNLKKGYEGEVMFDDKTREIRSECLILNDLLFKHNNNTFQLDSVILSPQTIYLFEIKNFEGDFYYDAESDKLYILSSKKQVSNPLFQLKRSELLFQNLLQHMGYNLPIVSFVVFINPEFTLYQLPQHLPFILPTQVNRLIHNIDANSTQLDHSKKILADKLLEQHRPKSDYSNIPDYDYANLKKGITCPKCHTFIDIKGRLANCFHCGYKEYVSESIMRSVLEYRMLFPHENVTSSIIHDWCNVVHPKRVRKTLDQNLNKIGAHRWTYFQ